MRPITRGSASPPGKPANCRCPARSNATACLASSCARARSTTSGALSRRPARHPGAGRFRSEKPENWPLTPLDLTGQTRHCVALIPATQCPAAFALPAHTQFSGAPARSPVAPVHAKISGPIVMIGFGSIGKGTLPLIERHFEYDKSRFVIIDPHEDGEIANQHGVRFIKQGITRDNYRELLVPLLTAGGGQGFCVNLSVDTSSVDIMTMCQEIGALYIDTVVEPWLGFYFDRSAGPGTTP